MLLDILYLVVTTPLALFSCYICILALRMLIKNGLQEMPWMIVAMLPTCSLTLIAYWGWIITLARYVVHLLSIYMVIKKNYISYKNYIIILYLHIIIQNPTTVPFLFHLTTYSLQLYYYHLFIIYI